jgi:hypothetical protein
VRAGFWWGDLVGRDHLEDLGIDRKVMLKWICKKCYGSGRGRDLSDSG